MKYIIILLFSFISLGSNGQNELFEKVSKQYSLVITEVNNLNTTYDNITKTGFGFEFDYAWKLSGYNKKRNVFLSLPIGFQFFNSSNKLNLKVLQYGWKVRHELAKDKKWTPYLAYSLLLNQTWFEEIKGSVFGHQTRFSLGINKKIKNRLFFNIIINYSFTRLPSLNKAKADKFTRFSVGVGLRFG